MTEFAIVLTYDKDKKEVMITGAKGKDTLPAKKYDKIRTAGDIGTACKDFVIGVQSR